VVEVNYYSDCRKKILCFEVGAASFGVLGSREDLRVWACA